MAEPKDWKSWLPEPKGWKSWLPKPKAWKSWTPESKGRRSWMSQKTLPNQGVATLKEAKAVVTQYHKYLSDNSLIKTVVETDGRVAHGNVTPLEKQ